MMAAVRFATTAVTSRPDEVTLGRSGPPQKALSIIWAPCAGYSRQHGGEGWGGREGDGPGSIHA